MRFVKQGTRSGSGLRGLARITAWACWGWLAASIFIWAGMLWFSERSLPFTMLLYGPRWVVLAPLLILAPLALVAAATSAVQSKGKSRSQATLRISGKSLVRSPAQPLLALAGAAAISVFGIMGFRFSPIALATAGLKPPVNNATSPNRIRVLTLNAQGGEVVQYRVGELLARYQPSIMTFEECGRNLASRLMSLKEWHFEKRETLCLISRWPITARDTMPRAAFVQVSRYGYGGAGLVVAYTIQHPLKPIRLVSLHLETARKGLSGVLGSSGIINDETGLPDVNFASAGERFEINSNIRERESERAAIWGARHADVVPVIVTGDFNMPVESSIYRRYWSGLANAFSTAGNGFGFTKFEGRLLRIRIDHILTSPRWFNVRGSWVAEDVGSDHRPLIADLDLLP